MLQRLFFLILASLTCLSGVSQYKTVVYDLEKNFFNEGQPLPFETYIMLNGQVPQNVSLVEFQISKGGDENAPMIYANYWKKTKADQSTFHLPVNFKLRQNSEYGIKISYFFKTTSEEKTALYQTLSTSLTAYMDQSIRIDGKDVEMSERYKGIYQDINTIVSQGLQFYRNDLSFPFPGFSEIVRQKVKELDKLDLGESKFYQFGSKKDSTFNKREENFTYFNTRLNALKASIDSELVSYLNSISHIMVEQKHIVNYSTEAGQFILPVNLGYGAIYNSGDFSDLSYGSSPYVGLSFPLGNVALKNNFLSNSSISFGAYLNNFNDSEGVEVSGPLIGRPVFLGWGTRAFKVFRFNAGVVALQKDSEGSSFDVSQVYLRPSVNINVELGLWVGRLK